MKHADKDRDPAKAKKRAVADARCALRKLDLLDWLEELCDAAHDPRSGACGDFVRQLGDILIEGEEP